MSQVVLASRNAGKVREFQALLDVAGLDLRPLSDFVPDDFEVEETGTTFEQNAWLKASAVCQATGLMALADDSGLEVDALAGRPGVYSARFAGPGASDDDNNRLLVSSLAGIPLGGRTARFRAVLVLCAWVGGRVVQVARSEGVLEGAILEEPRGSGGFGYDCLFEPAEMPGRTTAEMSLSEKNVLSHRGQAARALKPALVAWCASLPRV